MFVVSFSDYLKSTVMLKTTHYQYDNFYPVARSPSNDDIWLNFRVKAYSNAHILFSPANSLYRGMEVYEIVLGANHNKYCSIRKQQLRETLTHVEFANMVSGDEFRSFWVHISSKGLIEIGNKGNDLPFMMYQDNNLLNIQYFSFSSWYNTAALWSWGFEDRNDDDMEDFEILTGTESSFSDSD